MSIRRITHFTVLGCSSLPGQKQHWGLESSWELGNQFSCWSKWGKNTQKSDQNVTFLLFTLKHLIYVSKWNLWSAPQEIYSTSVSPERSKGQEGVDVLKRSTVSACFCSIKVLLEKGNADLLSSLWRKRECIFTPKQTFSNNKDFASEFWKISSPANLNSICRDRCQSSVPINPNLRKIPFHGNEGRWLHGWLCLHHLCKVNTRPWNSKTHFLSKKKKSILYFSSYSWKPCQKQFP